MKLHPPALRLPRRAEWRVAIFSALLLAAPLTLEASRSCRAVRFGKGPTPPVS